MLNKRSVLGLWLVLLLAGYAAASQIWYQATYRFDGTTKLLKLSGLGAWGSLTGAFSLAAVGLVALFLTRSLARRILAPLLALANLGLTWSNLPTLTTKVSPALNAMVEKASGISGGGSSGASAAIVSVQQNTPMITATFALLIAICAVSVLAAIGAGKWAVTDKADRYQRKHNRDAAQVGSAAGKPVSGDAATNQKGENIDLWDSQR